MIISGYSLFTPNDLKILLNVKVDLAANPYKKSNGKMRQVHHCTMLPQDFSYTTSKLQFLPITLRNFQNLSIYCNLQLILTNTLKVLNIQHFSISINEGKTKNQTIRRVSIHFNLKTMNS